MRDCTIGVAKTKALISFAVTAKLISAFVYALANIRFSHGRLMDGISFSLKYENRGLTHLLRLELIVVFIWFFPFLVVCTK